MIPPTLGSIVDMRRRAYGADVNVRFFPGDYVKAFPIRHDYPSRDFWKDTPDEIQGTVSSVLIVDGQITYMIVPNSLQDHLNSPARQFSANAAGMSLIKQGDLRRYYGGHPPVFHDTEREQQFYALNGLLQVVQPDNQVSWIPLSVVRALKAGTVDMFSLSTSYDEEGHRKITAYILDNDAAARRVRRFNLRKYRFWWLKRILLIDESF